MKNTSRTRHDNTPYRKLQQHLDRQPIGFPPSGSGADIRLLQHIFTADEARIATCLSHEPRSVDQIYSRARNLVSSKNELADRLTSIVKKGGLEYKKENGQAFYANAPLVVGIYELQVNRLTPEFIRDFKAYTSEKRFGISFLATKRSQMRTIPVNKSITPDLPAADYDQILTLIETAAPPFVVLPCICRKKKAIQENPCKQTDRSDTCMAMGSVAQTLIKMNVGREIPKADAVDIIRKNQEDGLVLQPSNTRKIDFLCSCCGCCCSMLGLQKDLPRPLDFWENGYTVVLDLARCVGCGRCGGKCATQALSLRSDGPVKKQKFRPELDLARCIGCGHCVAACKTSALTLAPRPGQAPPPGDRDALNRSLLEAKKNPLIQAKTVGKLARGIIAARDIRLLKQDK